MERFLGLLTFFFEIEMDSITQKPGVAYQLNIPVFSDRTEEF
jgi:hypothetical protein